MSKLTLAAAGAVGYVLGARAGRERYEELSNKATSLWRSPTVQKGKRHAEDKAKDLTSDGTESSLSEVGDHGDSPNQFNV